MLSDNGVRSTEWAIGSREHDSSAGVISAQGCTDQSLTMTKESAALSPMAGLGVLIEGSGGVGSHWSAQFNSVARVTLFAGFQE